MIITKLENTARDEAVEEIANHILDGDEIQLQGREYSMNTLFAEYTAPQLAFVVKTMEQQANLSAIHQSIVSRVRGYAMRIYTTHARIISGDGYGTFEESAFHDGYHGETIRFPKNIHYLANYGRGYEQAEKDSHFTQQEIKHEHE